MRQGDDIVEKCNTASIDKLNKQIRKLSEDIKRIDTAKVNKKDLIREVKLKDLDEKVEQNKKDNAVCLEKTTIISNGDKELETKIRSLYNENKLDKTMEIEILSEDIDEVKIEETVEIPVVDNVIEMFDNKLSNISIISDDSYSKIVIFLFFIFIFLVLFYIIFFMALSFA